jgi:hypothetical protein
VKARQEAGGRRQKDYNPILKPDLVLNPVPMTALVSHPLTLEQFLDLPETKPATECINGDTKFRTNTNLWAGL